MEYLKRYILNEIKTFLFIIFLSLLGVLLGFLIFSSLNPSVAKLALYYSIAMVIIYNLVSLLLYKKLILTYENAIELEVSPLPKEKIELIKDIVYSLSRRAKIPLPEIYIIPKEEINAFALHIFGRPVIGITIGSIKYLNEDELQGVIAHEIAHIKHRDSLYMTVVSVLTGFIFYLINYIQYLLWLNLWEDRENNSLILISQILLIIFLPIIVTLIRLAISRSREYLADLEGAKLINSPESLIKALIKIKNFYYENNFSPTSILYFHSNDLFSTHPSIDKRIENLIKAFNLRNI